MVGAAGARYLPFRALDVGAEVLGECVKHGEKVVHGDHRLVYDRCVLAFSVGLDCY